MRCRAEESKVGEKVAKTANFQRFPDLTNWLKKLQVFALLRPKLRPLLKGEGSGPAAAQRVQSLKNQIGGRVGGFGSMGADYVNGFGYESCNCR